MNDTARKSMGVSFDLVGALQVRKGLDVLVDERMPWFQERSIRTLARRLPVQARRDIQAEYNIGAARVREHLRAYAIPGQGTVRLAGVRLVGQWKRGVGLLNFSGRQTRKGVTYSVFRGRRQLAPSAFVARLKSGNEQAVQRYGEKNWKRTYTDTSGKRRTRVDQRIEVLYRSSIAQMLAKGRRPERLVDYSRNLLIADVERQFGSYLRTGRTTNT